MGTRGLILSSREWKGGFGSPLILLSRLAPCSPTAGILLMALLGLRKEAEGTGIRW